ncbi:YhdP family protein [Pseudoduganella plicata]|uniref:DUF3971 domain-containing protein n=1 Tax=Pseudoduganella plicata TaxID=321984 RepID=A0AA87YAW1_9BURK|nr:YhdP family protein [Pseudoduganella plicata]GGY82900.1 DUF3971 domain-containing protein [Pseudoduganella plicata]
MTEKSAEDKFASPGLPPPVDEPPIVARWHRLQAFYRLCNVASHHVLGFTLKLALLLYFVFAVVVLVLRYAVLPQIDNYKPDIERLASRAVGNPVTIDRIYASWSGLHPSLFLGDVVLRDRDGRQALRLPSVSATLSWWSLVTMDVRFDSIELIRPNLDVSRTADGRLFVAGIFVDLNKKDDGKGSEWVLGQREIIIREGRLEWRDAQRGTPPLVLQNMNLILRNQWRRHQFAIHAVPASGARDTLDLRADFSHPAFAKRVSDVRQWKGTVYAAVRGDDLAAWQPYNPYGDAAPARLQSGRGTVRAWLDIDHAHLYGVTADVDLDNLRAALGSDLPALDVASMRGRVAYSEDKPGRGKRAAAAALPFSARGHRASITGLTVRTRDGVVLAPTTLAERYVPASGRAPASTEVTARTLDLGIVAELATRLPLAPAQRSLLAELAPRGRVSNLDARWLGPAAAPQAWRVRAELHDLGMNPLAARAATPAMGKIPAVPGFDHLTGSVDAAQDHGSVRLDAPGLVLNMPAWFAEPAMAFQQLQLKASWKHDDQGTNLAVDSFDFAQDGLTGNLKGTHRLAGTGPGIADFKGTLDGFTLNRIGRYLPIATPERLHHWLTGALEGGTATEATVRLRGDLAHFPFADNTPDRDKGEFRVAGKLADAKLNYEPGVFAKDGVAPLWPQAEQIRGTFVFDRASMEIKADTARTGNVNLTKVRAYIADLIHHDSILEIDGFGAGAMQDYLRYVANSPVLEWIGHFTDQTTATGNARLALKLQLPLARLRESKVQGSLQLQGNDVVLWHDMPPVLLATGKIEFNEHGMNLNGLNGTLLGGQLTVAGGTQRDGTIQVRIGGNVTADGLRRTYPSPVMQKLAERFSGGTRYNGVITAANHQYQVFVESALTGVALDFPAPLAKTAADALPLHFVLNGGAASEAGLAHDEIRISLGSAVEARYQRERQDKQPWRLVRGGIGVNVPAPQPDSGMALHASVKSLNVDDWTGLASEIFGAAGPKTAEGAEEGPNLSQYVAVDLLAARADELTVGGRKVDNVVVGVTHGNGAWQANIDSRQANGYVTWNESPTGRGMGKVTARLSSLIIPESAAGDVKDLLEKSASASAPAIPALDIVAERFELFNRQLGRMELQAYNALITSSREWRVSRLTLENPDGVLHGTGRWVSRNGKHDSSLNFALDIVDAGKLLDRFGFADTLKGGKGKLSGDISWKGLPYSLDIPTLSGKLVMGVEKGQFLKQDPGAAKLLGVLSLQALPRLLKFDFHDVLAQGLAFDGISATAQIDRGIAKTDNLKMHGVQATVLMSGTADIANESTNLHVVVIPQVNFGTAPLVYALAVNPVIGLGSYLAQLFLSAPVMKALTYQMQVTGPWKAPVITKLDTERAEPQQAVRAQ